MDKRKKPRRAINFPVEISWCDGRGHTHTGTARALDLSDTGIRIESSVRIERWTHVHVRAAQCGLKTNAIVRHSIRQETTYLLGLEFEAAIDSEHPKAFVDYYELLQISPNAELETIRRVYKLLAARVNPDNPRTGDDERFRIIKDAFDTLSDPDRRAAYDASREQRTQGPLPIFELADFALGVDGETNRRIGILCLLYNQRRASEDKPGLSIMDLEKLMAFPREHLAFAVWYLKSKNFVATGESSDIVVTSEGVDYLEAHLPANRVAYQLLKGAETGTMHCRVAPESPVAAKSEKSGVAPCVH